MEKNLSFTPGCYRYMYSILDSDRLIEAIYKTVAYSDIFDFPLTLPELHRYLEGISISIEDLQLVVSQHLPATFAYSDGYLTLKNRTALLERRKNRLVHSQSLWPYALRYGRIMASLPYVRMVAVTGSLAMDNADRGGDIDFFVVTEPNRLWLTRAMIIGIVRMAAKEDIELCPNYLVTLDALDSLQQTLYTARELAQMVPLAGFDVYAQLRQVNQWTNLFLPNASGCPRQKPELFPNAWQKRGEWLLSSRMIDHLEGWEMRRKIKKFKAFETLESETRFSPQYCKGHFNAYQQPTLSAYQSRLTSDRQDISSFKV